MATLASLKDHLSQFQGGGAGGTGGDLSDEGPKKLQSAFYSIQTPLELIQRGGTGGQVQGVRYRGGSNIFSKK